MKFSSQDEKYIFKDASIKYNADVMMPYVVILIKMHPPVREDLFISNSVEIMKYVWSAFSFCLNRK